jgi:predicted nucleic acid-binding protein
VADGTLVVNASPLIVLAKAGHLDLLHALSARVIVPDPVVVEIMVGPPADPARRAIESGWGVRIPSVPVPAAILQWSLGAGESSVLSTALAMPGSKAALDDADARSCARVLGIPVVGTLGLVLRAKVQESIPSAAVVLRALVNAGLRLDDAVIRDALQRVTGETWP